MVIRIRMRRETYHRFVNTTPKPKATKKSKGELVGPPPPELGAADDDAVGEGITVLEGIWVVAAEVAIFTTVYTKSMARFAEVRLGRSSNYTNMNGGELQCLP